MAVFHCPDPDPREYFKPYVKRDRPARRNHHLINGDAYAGDELLLQTWTNSARPASSSTT